MIAAPLPAVYRLAERAEADGLYRDYRADDGRTWTVKATCPAGVLPEPDTAAVAARAFACSVPGRPACRCPEHPDAVLVPFPGGGARGYCPVDDRSYQMTVPEVTW